MDSPTLLILLKISVMILFFLIVVLVGTLPIRSKNFKRRPLLRAIGATFAGALFINVSIMHILPESADALEKYLREAQKKKEDEEVFPLAYLFLMVGFLITVFFTKVLSFHSHEDDHKLEENENTSSSSEEDKKDIEEENMNEVNEQQNKRNQEENLKESLLSNQKKSHHHNHGEGNL